MGKTSADMNTGDRPRTAIPEDQKWNSATIGRIILYVVVFLIVAIWIAPLIWVAIVSFKPSGSRVMDVVNWVTPPYTFDNYIHVVNSAPIFLWLFNSFIIAIVTTLFVLFLSALAAFSFSQNRFPGDRILFWVILAGLMVPGEAILVPLYILIRDMSLLDTYPSQILPNIAAPFGMILLKQFFDGLPKDMFEAAKMDGCSIYRMLFSIAIPLSKPALAALGIFTFLFSWNNFIWPFISLTSPEVMTVPVGIPFFNSGYTEDYTIPMAANVITSIPVLIVFFLFQKQIIKGISFTGLKG